MDEMEHNADNDQIETSSWYAWYLHIYLCRCRFIHKFVLSTIPSIGLCFAFVRYTLHTSSLSLQLFVHLVVNLSGCHSVFISAHFILDLPAYMSIRIPVSSVYLSIRLSARMLFRLSIRQYNFICAYPLIHLTNCLFVCCIFH